MASTPEPQTSRPCTPPTPGPFHEYHPYSPRRSTRSTAQRNPYSSVSTDRSPPSHAQRHSTPPPTVKRARFARTNTQLSSPPSSPASPAVQRRLTGNNNKTPRKLLSTRNPTTNTGAAGLSDSDHAPATLAPHLQNSADPANMLPTPSKTPTHRHKNASAVKGAARILSFQPNHMNEAMPTPRKVKKHGHGRFNSMNGFDLYDEQRARRGETGIEIFTDANARVPELDEAEDNPFVGPKSTSARPQRRSARRAAQSDAMDEAAERQEGMVYVFRGKKVFRRFSNPETETDRSSSPATELGFQSTETTGQRTLRRQAGAAAQRPLTRSSIKPRLLFPSDEEIRAREAEADRLEEVDEEAVTDVEMGGTHTDSPILVNGKGKAAVSETPTRKYKPASPPTTTRATRSSHMSMMMESPTLQTTPIIGEADADPMSVGTGDSFSGLTGMAKRGRKSPFDSWQRTKSSRKRAGEANEEGFSGKRTRGMVGSPA